MDGSLLRGRSCFVYRVHWYRVWSGRRVARFTSWPLETERCTWRAAKGFFVGETLCGKRFWLWTPADETGRLGMFSPPDSMTGAACGLPTKPESVIDRPEPGDSLRER